MSRNLLPSVPTYEGSLFTWSGNVGVVEDSLLQGIRNDRAYEQLYADSADVGFKVHSAKTGRTELFVFVKNVYEYRGNERELMYGLYVCAGPRNVAIRVFND